MEQTFATFTHSYLAPFTPGKMASASNCEGPPFHVEQSGFVMSEFFEIIELEDVSFT